MERGVGFKMDTITPAFLSISGLFIYNKLFYQSHF